METTTAPSSIHPGSKLLRAAKSRRILIATDFGGTLCTRKDGFRPDEPHCGTLCALERLSALPGVHIAIASGRGSRELSLACAGLPPCWKISDHGRACADPSGRGLLDWPSHAGTGPLERAMLQGESLFEGTGARMEMKRFSVLVRYPSSSPLEVRGPADRWSALTRSFGLEVVQGRGFMEALVPGFDKRRALTRLSAHLRCDFRVFGGDDGHDLPALAELTGRPDGLSVFVASPERPSPGIRVDALVDGPDGWAAWLQDLADVLETRGA